MRVRFKPPQTNKNRIKTKPTKATGPGKDAQRVLAARASAAKDPKIASAIARENAQRILAAARHTLANAKLDLSEAEEEQAAASVITAAAAAVTTAQNAYEAAKVALAALPGAAS